MKRFIPLKFYDAERDEGVTRLFNVDYIRHIDPERNEVQLNGARSPILVSTDTMNRLIHDIVNDEHVRRVGFFERTYNRLRLWIKSLLG